MKTLIAYSTKYGAAKECAERIARRLPRESTLIDLDTVKTVDLAPYDQVIIGASVYMGKARKAASRFAKSHLDALMTKKVGLYLCCIQDIDKNVKEQFAVAYPQRLREHAAEMEQLGGVVDFRKLGKIDGVIMNMIAGDLRKKTNSEVISTLSDERIDMFCRAFVEPPAESGN